MSAEVGERLDDVADVVAPGEVEFSENKLEFPLTRLLDHAESPEFMIEWIRQHRARQAAMPRHLLGPPLDAPLQEREAQLKDRLGS